MRYTDNVFIIIDSKTTMAQAHLKDAVSIAYNKHTELTVRRDTIIAEVTQSITKTYAPLIQGALADYVRYSKELLSVTGNTVNGKTHLRWDNAWGSSTHAAPPPPPSSAADGSGVPSKFNNEKGI